MNELARVQGSRRGGVSLVLVEGEVDLSNAQQVGAMIRSLAGNEATSLVVDLTHTTYLDSAGIALLITLAERLRARRRQFRLVVPPTSPVHRVLQLTGLPDLLVVHAGVDEALADQDAAPP